MSHKKEGKNLQLSYKVSHKCSKISNNFLFLISSKILNIKAGIPKILVGIANRKDPDQTASSEAVCSGSALFVMALCLKF